MKKEEAKQNLNKTHENCDLWDMVVPLNVWIKDMDDWGEEEGVDEVDRRRKMRRRKRRRRREEANKKRKFNSQ